MIKNYLTISEVALLMSTSYTTASRTVKKLNEELESEGFIAIRGKIPIQLLKEKMPYIDLSNEALKEWGILK